MSKKKTALETSVNGHKDPKGAQEAPTATSEPKASAGPQSAAPQAEIRPPSSHPSEIRGSKSEMTVQDLLKDEPIEVPPAYGQDTMVLMVRDPWWIFAYWELEQKKRAEAMQKLQAGSGLRSVLRLHDVTARDIDRQGSNHFQDFECPPDRITIYLKVAAPDRDYLVELGLLD